MKVLVSGSSGLIGSEAVVHYDALGAEVIGIDNNLRAEFFGPQGDTRWNLQRLQASTRRFRPHAIDLRDREALFRLFQAEGPFDRVIHCAAQPSHDKAREIPVLDFEVNANGTLHMLEATRLYSPDRSLLELGGARQATGCGPQLRTGRQGHAPLHRRAGARGGLLYQLLPQRRLAECLW